MSADSRSAQNVALKAVIDEAVAECAHLEDEIRDLRHLLGRAYHLLDIRAYPQLGAEIYAAAWPKETP